MSARESRMSPSRDGSYFVSRVLPEAFWSICRTWLRETAWPVATLKVRPEALGASQARMLASAAVTTAEGLGVKFADVFRNAVRRNRHGLHIFGLRKRGVSP